jgi:large subunit ribosomal protein L6
MSRIIRKSINIPDGVKIKCINGLLEVVGSKGSLLLEIIRSVDIIVSENNKEVNVKEKFYDEANKAILGTTAVLLKNMIFGVMFWHTQKLKFVGVGYKASLNLGYLVLYLGYSHLIYYKIPNNIYVDILDNNEILVRGVCKQKVGQVSAEIRRKRPPERYKGKGIRYIDEIILLKEGKKK